jgi:hypothetical protein
MSRYTVRTFPAILSTQTRTDFFEGYLKNDEGMSADRFEAFSLPSMVNGKETPAVKPKADMVAQPRCMIP